MTPQGSRLLFAGILLAAAPACSLLYAGYDERFAGADGGPEAAADASSDGGPFATLDGSIAEIAVTPDGLLVSVLGGTSIVRLPLDGGVPATFWRADAAPGSGSVLSLASNGASVIWGFGEQAAVDNAVWVGEAAGGARALVARGTQIGRLVAAGPTLLAWSAGEATCGATCDVARAVAAADGSDAGTLGFPPPKGVETVALKALSVDPGGVDGIGDPPIFARFPAAGGAPCVRLGFPSGIAAVASDGARTFILASSNLDEGDIRFYDEPCPSALDAGVLLGTSAVLLAAADGGGAVWAVASGQIFEASSDAAVALGSVHARPTALVTDDRFVYVAADQALYRIRLAN